MKLTVVTPTAIVLEAADVQAVRAEDDTGSFGILPHHTHLLTVLTPSVIVWRDRADVLHYVAVRGGVLRVRQAPSGGETSVEVATSEAMAGDDLDALRAAVLARYEAANAAELAAKAESARLRGLAVRGIYRLVRGEPLEGA